MKDDDRRREFWERVVIAAIPTVTAWSSTDRPAQLVVEVADFLTEEWNKRFIGVSKP